MKIHLLVVLCAGVSYAASCDSVAAAKFDQTIISSAQVVAAGAFVPPSGPKAAIYKKMPEFCRVQGVLSPSNDSNIQFEVWLPVNGWNGRYLGVGNGGFGGSIGYTALADAVANGYAVSSTDTGHQGGATDGLWALGHYEKIVDFGYRAIHDTANTTKAIIKTFYGGVAKRSYFSSCSNGGRQALMEAQRYPADYDGIIAGAPANYFTHLLVGAVWDSQAQEGAAYIPPAKVKLIDAAALEQCDATDGLKDGLINDPTKCHFNPAKLECKGAATENCLTSAQVKALEKIYAGPKNSKGEQIFPGYEPGGELGMGGWPLWITGLAPGKSLQIAFANGFFADMTFEDATWDYRKMNFDKDVATTDDKDAQIFNATDPNLTAFKDRGGKLLIYHGWSDAAIPPTNSIHYYQSVQEKLGSEEAAVFMQLYMVPGMQHCGGGPGPDEFGATTTAPADADHSMITALEQWVEKGAAPKKIIATKYKVDGNPESGVVRSRPLCPYPMEEKYSGSGSVDDAANFSCVAK